MILLLLALIFFIALMGFTLNKRDELSWPEKFVNDTVSFAQGLIYKPASYIAGLFEDIRKMRIVYKENEELKITAAHYYRDKYTYNMIQQENERLKKALDFTEKQKNMYNYKYHIAQVIAANPDPFNSTIKINLGSSDGIEPNMAVATVDGLIGRVTEVAHFYSTVQLITDLDENSGTTKAIAATVYNKENQSFGMIEKYDKQTGMLTMTKIAENDPLAEGDTIISSGIGLVFPRGVVIGKVVSRQVGEAGLTSTATIKPAADFSHWTEVFVIEVPKLEEK